MQKGYAVPEIVTGKPISLGGSLFRHEATGAGVVMVIERACRRLGWDLAAQRCVVQGFGNVGGIAAQELVDRGAKVIAVSDVSGGIHDEAGSTSRRRARTRSSTGRSPASPTGAHLERRAARARLRHPRARGARGPGARRERAAAALPADRRGRERPDVARGRRDPRRARNPRAARHPHERRRRHRLLLRMGAGSRPPLLGPRRDPGEARREARTTRSTASGTLGRARDPAARRRRSSPGSARWRPRSKPAASIPDDLRASPGRDGRRAAHARRLGDRAQTRAKRSRGPRCGPCSSATTAGSSASSRGRRSSARSSPPASTRRATRLGDDRRAALPDPRRGHGARGRVPSAGRARPRARAGARGGTPRRRPLPRRSSSAAWPRTRRPPTNSNRRPTAQRLPEAGRAHASRTQVGTRARCVAGGWASRYARGETP